MVTATQGAYGYEIERASDGTVTETRLPVREHVAGSEDDHRLPSGGTRAVGNDLVQTDPAHSRQLSRMPPRSESQPSSERL
ncbi:hypothetical protein AFB00_12275 [Pseudonocardia sp. HH130630-07]|nr:hypothetical protein AFB00_12275 [Pseudonocardia sp. HH130630-07]